MSHLDDVLYAAPEEARKSKTLNGLVIEVDNGNTLLVVVGSEETVLIFNYGGPDPPYYASKGTSDDDDPILTCYITFQHHTEFPRKNVISIRRWGEGCPPVPRFRRPPRLHQLGGRIVDEPHSANWSERGCCYRAVTRFDGFLSVPGMFQRELRMTPDCGRCLPARLGLYWQCSAIAG